MPLSAASQEANRLIGVRRCPSHSLGTVVTYTLLRSQSAAAVPFFLTLGSPLAGKAVKNAIGPSLLGRLVLHSG
jgi:hypothetical protein